MNRPLLLRRYGRGSARIAIGRPTRHPGLAPLAQARSRGARRLTLGPVLALALAVLLLPLVDFAPPESATPTRIVLQPPTPEVPETSVVPPEPIVPPVERTRPRLAEAAPEAPAPARASVPDATPLEVAEPTPAFDPRDLIVAARPREAKFELDAGGPTATPLPRRAPTARHPGDALTADLSAATRQAASPAPTDWPGTGPHGVSPRRVRPTREGASASAQAVADLGTPHGTGEDFLEHLTGPASRGRVAPERRAGLPPVSAPAAAAREVEAFVRGHAERAGWESVPLDTLPDCSPPGRQDQLKRAVLRATGGREECTRGGAAFRFLQTRNLNGFLMWSRMTNGETGSASARLSLATEPAADACVVLERALRCLEGEANKEFPNR